MRASAGNLLLAACAAVVGLGAVEGLIRTADLFAPQRRSADASAADARATQSPSPGGPGGTILHPYLGYVRRPDMTLEPSAEDLARFFAGDADSLARFQALPPELRRTVINLQGFASHRRDYGALRQRKGQMFVVGIFGGSVADSFAAQLSEGLASNLAAALGVAKETIEIVNFANLGYHQPQQVIALTQAVLMGVPFDLVLNIDGFNEVAFGGLDCQAGYHPLFPSTLQYLATVDAATQGTSTETLTTILRLRTLRDREAWLRRVVGASPLSLSETARAVAGTLIAYSAAERAQIEDDLQHAVAERPRSDLPVLLPAPEQAIAAADCMETIAAIWQTASLLMNAIARQSGAAYLHVLQPNQYVEGSKPLSDEERSLAFRPSLPAARAVRAGYPVLLRGAPQLAQQGVAVVDLTKVFRATPETVYIDQCCHLNSRGNRLMFDSLLPAMVAASREKAR